MITVHTVLDLQAQITRLKAENQSIGFVPTMGALHEGHLSLMRKAKEEQDVLVVSIFVNPLQFGPGEDYDTYPRTIDKDKELLSQIGADVLFMPSVKEMYPRPLHTSVSVQKGADVLCGKSRPGHFDGVLTVVLKLFQLVQPHAAYFGKKDAQQVAVIQNMVEDFHIPVKIVPVDTVRERDGLAVSSRNVRLTPEERKEAPHLYQSLQLALTLIQHGTTNCDVIKEKMREYLKQHTSGEIDYIDILTFPTLTALSEVRGTIIIAIAVQFSEARLIDNVIVDIAYEKGEVSCIARL